jgi:hypothetical protein
MAVYSSNKMLAGTQPKVLPSAGGVNVLAIASLSTALNLNDTINMVQLAADASDPNGSGPTIIGMVLDCDKLDSGGTPAITLSVGDSGSATRYFNASTIAQNGGYAIPAIPAILGYQPFASAFGAYPTPSLALYTIFVTCAHAPATWQNGNVRLLTEFSYDP